MKQQQKPQTKSLAVAYEEIKKKDDIRTLMKKRKLEKEQANPSTFSAQTKAKPYSSASQLYQQQQKQRQEQKQQQQQLQKQQQQQNSSLVS